MLCQYRAPDGRACHLDAQRDGWCLWHHPASNSAQQADVKTQLETWVSTEHTALGFHLAYTDLNGIHLTIPHQNAGLDMAYSDFYRANLQHAHMFHINLHDASLMKADCRYANLNCANLENANLLGTNFEHAKLEHVRWGQQILQEQQACQALKRNDKQAAQDYFEQAEEIYRNLYRELAERGYRITAGHFFLREMIMRRKQMPLWSMRRVLSKCVDLVCGYGERPLRVIGFSWSVILICSLLYCWLGIRYNEALLRVTLDATWQENLACFGNCLYFSVVTFTTLGYGDLTPIGLTRLIAACEAFCGSFSIALFVVVFVKKMTF